MTETREALINRLATDMPPVRGRLSVYRLAVAWLVLGTLMATTFIAMAAPFRPGFLAQLVTVPRFTLEMGLGAAAIAALVVAVLRMGVPGATRGIHIVLPTGLTLLWLFSIFLSLFYPALELGTLGERSICWLETQAYGIPVMGLGFWLVSRGYVLRWVPVGFLLGLVSGLFPALLMQVACMYEAKHALYFHIAPAVSLALPGTLIGIALMQRRARG